MKILYVIESAAGGSGKHLIDLTEELLNRGHEIHVVYSSLRMDKNFTDFLERNKDKSFQSLSLNMKSSPYIKDIYYTHKIRKYIKSNGNFDVVHGHSSKAGALVRLACLGIKIPIFYTPHGIITLKPDMSKFKKLFYRLIEVFLSKISRKSNIIAVSDEEREHIVDLGISRDRVKCIFNGIKVPNEYKYDNLRSLLSVSKGDILIGTVSRFLFNKRVDLFIEAANYYIKNYHKNDKNVKFVILGYGEEESNLRELANKNNLDKHIVWVNDIVDDVQGFELMRELDVYVLPSNYEGMPYVLIESLFAGLPIISTNVGGANVMIEDNKNGYITDVGDHEAIAEKINLLVNDNILRSQMSKVSIERSKDFTLEIMVNKLLKLYLSK